MKNYIKDTLVNLHATCTTDQYGQMGKFNLSLNSLFGKRVIEVEEYLKTNPILKVSTYGGSYGTYRAITEIIDNEIKKECSQAFNNNPNYLRNLNSW